MRVNNVQSNTQWSVKEGLSEELTSKLRSEGWARVRERKKLSGRWSCGYVGGSEGLKKLKNVKRLEHKDVSETVLRWG